MKTILNKNRGFTLVELLVTVAITAILAAMAMSAFTHYKDQAYAAGALTIQHDVYTAGQVMFTEITANESGSVIPRFQAYTFTDTAHSLTVLNDTEGLTSDFQDLLGHYIGNPDYGIHLHISINTGIPRSGHTSQVTTCGTSPNFHNAYYKNIGHLGNGQGELLEYSYLHADWGRNGSLCQ